MDRNRTINPKVETMNTKMQKSLELLHKIDGKESCCIFRVPKSLLEINKEAYEPQIVSIGPYHCGKDHPIIHEHKWRYLDGLLKRNSKKTAYPLKSLLNSIVSMETKIRQSYSETIRVSSEDLAMMIVLDGVFLIELFRKFGNINHEHQNDAIFKMVWVLPFLMRDFLRIENQIPFFVLQELFDESKTKKDVCTLPSLILRFFNYGALRPKGVLRENNNLKGEHLLDFFRKSFLIKKPDASDEGTCMLCKQPVKAHVEETVPSWVKDMSGKRYVDGVALYGKETPDKEGTSTEIESLEIESISEETIPMDGAALYGNETPDKEGTSTEVESISEETVASYGNEMLKGPAARYGKQTVDEGTSNVPIQQGKMHPKETVANNRSFERIQSATKLVVAGVKFKKNDEAKSFLDIKFQKGVLLIPHINLDDFYTHFILNGMIFEQCYSNCSKDITTYIVFLGCLINTSMDVGLLSDRKIIQNYLGTDKELVKFFNNVVKYVALDVKHNYLLGVFKDINDYCDDGWHVGWAGFKHTYFDSPWTAISAFAAFVLLCLTVTQTFYTVYPYYYERI